MKLNLGSIEFNAEVATGGNTPAWGTEMGQGAGYKFSFEDMNEFFPAMVYNAIENCKGRVYCPLGKGGVKQDDYKYVIASLFNKVFVNGQYIQDASFILLIVELLVGDHHVGRRTLKYNKKITLDDKKINEDCFRKISKFFGLTENAAWFISEINFVNQDELHFTAHFIDKENKVVYKTAAERTTAFANMLDWTKQEKESYIANTKQLYDKQFPLQQIYYGAPGTGKSHTINKITDEYKADTIRTTFHPDSDYSTFVGAYKPTMEEADVQIVPVAVAGGITLDKNKGTYKEKRITYKFVKQAFLKAYLSAWKKYAEAESEEVAPQFLVIEEINRGNCAQIFGDLFQLLDRQDNGFSSYPIEADADLQREIKEAFANDEAYKLPESGLNLDGVVKGYDDLAEKITNGEILLLPSNLYIWATMNTSDQSLFPIDSAFKRRWDWKYVKITDAKKGYKIKCGDDECDWWKFISKMNDKIATETSSDDKKLGYFFCKPDDGDYISAERFVSKVMFYLWNDVFKDGDNQDFNVSGDANAVATFEAFYNDDNMVNVENVRKFLVKIVGESNLNPIVDGDEEEDENEDGSGDGKDHTQYAINGDGRFSKRKIAVELVKKYMKLNPGLSAKNVAEAWKPLGEEIKIGYIVETQEDYDKDTRSTKGKLLEKITCNGDPLWIAVHGWTSKTMNELKEALDQRGWGLSISEIEDKTPCAS